MDQKRVPPIRELRRITQEAKSHRTEWYYVIHRKLSIYITWALLHTPIVANQVTVLCLACGAIGAAVVMAAPGGWPLVGFFLFYAYFLLDKVDGEVARYRQQSSLRGMCLDYIGHLVIPPLLPLAVGGLLSGWWHEAPFWLAGSLAALATVFLRAARDIPLSIIFHKASVEAVVRTAHAMPASGGVKATQRPHRRPRNLLAQWMVILLSFFPSLFLLASAFSLTLFWPPAIWLFVGIFMLICCVQIVGAALSAGQLVRRVNSRIQLDWMQLLSITEDVKHKTQSPVH